MRRADRLFRLVQVLRARRFATARTLAEALEVSERTVYRDVRDLSLSGVPIEGEAGVGYRMRPGYDLAPLMFTLDEAQSLVAAVRMAQPRLDAGLALHAESALSKILAVLPASTRLQAERLAVYAPDVGVSDGLRQALATLRDATQSRHKLRFDYIDQHGASSQRTVRPLGSFFWGQVWTLAAWCESRQDFRNFRADRIANMVVLDERFADEPGRGLADFLRAVRAEDAGRPTIPPPSA